MSRVSRLGVALYIERQVWYGHIYQPYEERFLDLLNGTWVRQPESRGRFLSLADVTVHQPDSREERLPAAYINKATIQLATTLGGDAARGIGGRSGPKPYPFRQKSLVAVKLRTPAYTLTGNMHCFSREKVWQVLDGGPMFVPVTNVEIRALSNGLNHTVPFAAVNTEHILSLQEQGAPSPTPAG
jgi:hypothetical protein